MTSPKPQPPWVWDGLSEQIRAESWRRLTAWVEWLEEAYAPWVQLPPCWPVHEGLRTELIMFCYWHGWVMRAAVDPVDGIRWHNELRNSARAWRDLASCQHDPPSSHHQQFQAARLERRDLFLTEAFHPDDAPKPL